MKTQNTTLAAVLFVALALIGIGTMPVAGQVDPDCDDDFDIPDDEPTLPRSLAAMSSEVGRINVTGDEESVRVELQTEGKILFGVFVVDTNCIAASSPGSTCQDNESVETTDSNNPQHKDCELQPGETYYFHVVNDELAIHQYNIWQL